MSPPIILGSNNDWIESFRRTTYPRLHPHLKRVGGYGVGVVKENQHVCTLEIDEEVIEEELVEIGFRRNPIAAFKEHPDGRQSEGSWVLLADDDPTGTLEPGRQLHITLLPRNDSESGREVYAHNEYDWRVHPLKHLRESNFDAEGGADHARYLIDEHTYFDA